MSTTDSAPQSPGLLQENATRKQPDSSGYQPVFGLNNVKKDTVPRWLPLSLLALTTAALAVPVVLLRRQRAAALGKSLTAAPPPPRRTSVGIPVQPRVASSRPAPPPRIPTSSRTASPLPPSPSAAATQNELQVASDNFNGALYTAKAFGIATLYVSIGAGTMVWGVKTALGVRDTQEFADYMRSFVVTWMPRLSARIHRPPSVEDGLPESIPAQNSSQKPHLHAEPRTGTLEWSWPEAEQRLRAAYDKDGIMGWAQAALKELEAEGQVERVRRGHA